jgi:hypothetical protein
MVPRAGRKYKLTARIRVTTDATGGGVLSSNFHVNGLSTTLVHGNPTFSGTSVSGFSTSINPINVASGWQTISIIYTLGTPSTYDAFWRPRLDIIRTGGGSAGGSWEVAFFRIEDVTDSEAAAASATAASTSASSASTSATGAGTSATAAATSATTAATQASNASTSATNASTSAGNAASSATTATTQASNAAGSASSASSSASAASASATSASSSATLSANYAGAQANGLFINGKFLLPLVSGIPTGWGVWVGSGSLVARNGNANASAFRIAGGAATYAGVQQYSGPNDSIQPGRNYYLRATTWLTAGSYNGSGLYLVWFNAAGTPISDQVIPFATTPNTAGVTSNSHSGLTSWEMKVTAPALAVRAQVYAMTHWDAAGDISVANSLDWYECDLALEGYTSAQIQTNASAIATETSARAAADTTLTASVGTLTSSVATNASAITAVDGKLSASYALTVDGNGRIASMKLLSNGASSAVKFTADVFSIYNGTSDVPMFEVVSGAAYVAGSKVRTESVEAGAVTQTGRFTDDSFITVPKDTWTTVAEATITTVGGVGVFVNANAYLSAVTSGATFPLTSYRLRRDSTVIRTGPAFSYAYDGSGGMESAGNLCVSEIDDPAAGTYTYSLQAYHTHSTGAAFGSTGAVNRSMLLLELKR